MKPKKTANIIQNNLFKIVLKDIVNEKHPLVKLADSIHWKNFDEKFEGFYSDKGRKALPTRLLVGLHYLKYSYNLSDDQLVFSYLENPYYQYFCGATYFEHHLPLDSSSLTKWRNRLKEEDLEELLSETIKTALKAGFVKKKELEKVIVDTTVQEKNIRFPSDSRLQDRMREKLVNQAKKEGINLRQSYERVGKTLLLRISGYRKANQFKRAKKAEKKLKIILGRVVRDIERKAEKLSPEMKEILALAKRLFEQKRKDKNKIYSIHEPKVECIAKGKAHKKYEFGNKVSISSTLNSNWVVGSLAFHGNPYDGHTLNDAISQTEKLTETKVKLISVDLGYRKHDYQGSAEVYLSNRFRKKVKPAVKKIWKRRSAVEPIIGHLKSDNGLKRNMLKGVKGDKINPILAASGYNMRKLLKAFSSVKNFIRNFTKNYKIQSEIYLNISKKLPDLYFSGSTI
jgi:IS5 family transposase